MELRHLRSFCVLAEEVHVTRAAKRLGIAQPALTQQVRALEGELQTPLLRKVGRNIELTEAGAAFHKEALAILEKVVTACLRTQEVGRGSRGHILIGLTESAGFSGCLSKLLGKFRKNRPNVALTFTQNNTGELLSALAGRRVDVAMVCPPVPGPPRFNHFSFLAEPVDVAIPNGHPLANRRSIGLDGLREEPLIFNNDGGERRDFETALRQACTSRGFAPHIVQETPELILALNLVAAGMGITFVPRSVRGVRPLEITYRRLLTSPILLHKLSLVTRGDETSPAVIHLIELARTLAQGVIES